MNENLVKMAATATYGMQLISHQDFKTYKEECEKLTNDYHKKFLIRGIAAKAQARSFHQLLRYGVQNHNATKTQKKAASQVDFAQNINAMNQENHAPQNDEVTTQQNRPAIQQTNLNSHDHLPSNSSAVQTSISTNLANKKNEEEIMKIIADLTKEIDDMKTIVSKDENIEGYVWFLQKNLQKAYCYWSLGELTMKKQYYQLFFDFAIKEINFGPDSQSKILLYKNELKESKYLVFYLIMALVHLEHVKEAFGTLKFWLLHWDDKTVIQEESANLQDGEWLQILDQDPKEDIIDYATCNNHFRNDKSKSSFLISSLIAIKVEVILKMKRRLEDRKLVFKAFEQDNNVLIAKLMERYPDLEEAKLFDVSKVILEGIDLANYERELQNQIKCLKHYIHLCHSRVAEEDNLHPSFVTEILNSDTEIITKINKYRLEKDMYRQSCEYASLASCVSYFAKLFCNEKEMHNLIMDEVKSMEKIGRSSNSIGFDSSIMKRKRPSTNANAESGEAPSKRPVTSSSQDSPSNYSFEREQ